MERFIFSSLSSSSVFFLYAGVGVEVRGCMHLQKFHNRSLHYICLSNRWCLVCFTESAGRIRSHAQQWKDTHHPINCLCVSSVCVSSRSYRRDEGWNLEPGCQQHHPASHLSVMKSFRRWSLLLKGQDGFRLSLLVFGGKCSAALREAWGRVWSEAEPVRCGAPTYDTDFFSASRRWLWVSHLLRKVQEKNTTWTIEVILSNCNELWIAKWNSWRGVRGYCFPLKGQFAQISRITIFPSPLVVFYRAIEDSGHRVFL